MQHNIILIGPPASGKGTQAQKISEHYNIRIIKPGEIFRKHIDAQTQLGKIAEEYVNKGELLPDRYTNELVAEAYADTDVSRGVIFDGYPRSFEQAEALDKLLNTFCVIHIAVSEEEVIRRIRENDRDREDDTIEVIKNRLQVYKNRTNPILEEYRKKGIVYDINGEQSIDEVFADITRILDEHKC